MIFICLFILVLAAGPKLSNAAVLAAGGFDRLGDQSDHAPCSFLSWVFGYCKANVIRPVVVADPTPRSSLGVTLDIEDYETQEYVPSEKFPRNMKCVVIGHRMTVVTKDFSGQIVQLYSFLIEGVGIGADGSPEPSGRVFILHAVDKMFYESSDEARASIVEKYPVGSTENCFPEAKQRVHTEQ